MNRYSVCETPKSPPGDYNPPSLFNPTDPRPARVKHLNPRQGITTVYCRCRPAPGHRRSV